MEVQVEAKADGFDGDQDDQVNDRQGSWRGERTRGEPIRAEQSAGPEVHSSWTLQDSLTQEGEPGEEGGGAEAEQRQQQDQQVEGDAAGLAPPALKGARVRRAVAASAEEEQAGGGVPSPVGVGVRTDDCGTNQRLDGPGTDQGQQERTHKTPDTLKGN